MKTTLYLLSLLFGLAVIGFILASPIKDKAENRTIQIREVAKKQAFILKKGRKQLKGDPVYIRFNIKGELDGEAYLVVSYEPRGGIIDTIVLPKGYISITDRQFDFYVVKQAYVQYVLITAKRGQVTAIWDIL